MDKQRIARELVELAEGLVGESRVAAKELTAATEVPLKSLIEADPWVEGMLRKLASISPAFRTPIEAFSGIHGNVINFKSVGSIGVRLTADDLKKLGSVPKLRWFDVAYGFPSVGIEGSWID